MIESSKTFQLQRADIADVSNKDSLMRDSQFYDNPLQSISSNRTINVLGSDTSNGYSKCFFELLGTSRVHYQVCKQH